MIDLGNASREIKNEDILEVEKNIGAKFTPEYKYFIENHNGSRPEYNICKVSNNCSCGVDRFIDIDNIQKSIETLQDREVSNDFFPFADGESSNYFMMKKNGEPDVYFYDHEFMGKEALIHVASSFDIFLNMLRKRSTLDVVLKPGQVKRIWSDPTFVPKFEEE
ncbi:SMI1/KNR4 family protein [Novacetimonas cocois]|uniref:Knr4/Smi1-like domain-containing protein n=1 Tax=Novacetimonas cocois TaxID=1747507 RepID=A0A365YUX3_9PROT|nr:SMI1/KNR4 family protein [Novacetimonas cocois]RBM06547.1 hypothetical protein NJLHNGOC_09635 [Novacetimonas cocois]